MIIPSDAEAPAAPLKDAIAILPFDVFTENDLAPSGDEMVVLLNMKMDGMASIRALDPHVVLGYTRRRPDLVMDQETGGEIADLYGATHYVLGNIVSAGVGIQISATLYDRTGIQEAEASVSFTEQSEYMSAVDKLTNQLVRSKLEESEGELAALSLGTTHSFEALKLYLEASRALRQADYRTSAELVEQALELDSTFSMAWWLRARIAGWGGLPFDEVGPSREKAWRYPEKMPELLRRINFEAPSGLEERTNWYQNELRQQPESIELNSRLGDMLFHQNPFEFRDASEAIPYFERVLEIAPGRIEFNDHLISLYLQQENHRAADSLVAEYAKYNPIGAKRWKEVLRLLHRDAQFQERFVDSLLVNASDEALGDLAYFTAWADHPVSFSSPMAFDKNVLRYQQSASAMGLDRAISKEIRLSESFLEEGPNFSRVITYNLTPSSLLNVDDLNQLQEYGATIDAFPVPYRPTLYSEQREIFLYFLGLLAWRNDDVQGLGEKVEALRNLNSLDSNNEVALLLAARLEGLRLFSDGDFEGAVQIFDDGLSRNHWPRGQPSFPTTALTERYHRGLALYELGRKEEALASFRSLVDGGLSHALEWAAHAHEKVAQIHDELGNTERAIFHYAKFIMWWENAADRLQPRVEAARERMNELVVDSAREPAN